MAAGPFSCISSCLPVCLACTACSAGVHACLRSPGRRAACRPLSPFDPPFPSSGLLQELELMIYNWLPYFTLKDSVMDPSYDGPDMW